MARKQKTTRDPPRSDDDARAPVRPAQKLPERFASPFAAALAGVKAAPAPVKRAVQPLPGAPRSFAAALAARKSAIGADVAVAGTAVIPEPPRTFAEALEVRERGAAPAAKAAERSLAERAALRNALAGVTPLSERDKRRVAVPPLGASQPTRRGERLDPMDLDAEARQRLAALVASGLRFEVHEGEDGRVQGTCIEPGGRAAVDSGAFARLSRADVDGEFDLHGMTGDEAEAGVSRWVRSRHRSGARVVRLIYGKGLHSEGGVSVLRERVIHALTAGGAAPLVRGFASAAVSAGGTGALIVQLAGRV